MVIGTSKCLFANQVRPCHLKALRHPKMCKPIPPLSFGSWVARQNVQTARTLQTCKPVPSLSLRHLSTCEQLRLRTCKPFLFRFLARRIPVEFPRRSPRECAVAFPFGALPRSPLCELYFASLRIGSSDWEAHATLSTQGHPFGFAFRSLSELTGHIRGGAKGDRQG